MAEYTVTITVDFDDCEFTFGATRTVFTAKGKKRTRVTGKKLRVKKNDKVSWICGDGNFCGVFKGDSPLDAAGFAGMKGQPTDKIKVTADHKPGGDGPNTYPYFVAVVDPDDGEACVYDPDIIIDP